MALFFRQKVIIILLLFYWPGIFILAHIPVPRLVLGVGLSDKTLHYVAYLILVFLLWFAISPDKKVRWNRAAAWWVLFVIVWYGVIDEWLQGISYVGRDPDVMDFFADLAGALTGLILLTVFPFWPVSLMLTGAVIFVLTNLMQSFPAETQPAISIVFHLFAYAFFSLLWARYMHYLLPVRPPQPRWLIGVLALPVGFLLAMELFSAAAGNGFRPMDVIISAGGIGLVVVTYYITAVLRRRIAKKRL